MRTAPNANIPPAPDKAISKRTYLISTAAFALWIADGVMIGRLPIIVFNVQTLVRSGAILVLKLRAQKHANRA